MLNILKEFFNRKQRKPYLGHEIPGGVVSASSMEMSDDSLIDLELQKDHSEFCDLCKRINCDCLILF